jgi:hypothetical protein
MRSLARATALLACLAASARAEGPGVKLGEALVLHPGLALGAGYDSNLFYASGNPGDPTTGVGYVSIRPVVDLATLSLQRGGDTPHTLDFRLHAGMNIRLLTTGDPNLTQHYSVDVDSGMALSVFPFGNYTFDLFDNYTRLSVPPYNTVKFPGNINSDQNQLGLRLRLRPGGQRLEFGIQYVFGLYFFEGGPFAGKNNLSHDFQLRISWKFFPKTALYLQASESIYSYVNNDVNTPPSAFPFRVVLGMIGLITSKLTVNANIGYGNTFTTKNMANPVEQFNSVPIGLIEGTWKPTLQTSVSLGYRHDFAQSLIGTYYELNSAYLALSQLLWRITGTLRVGWEMRQFHGNVLVDGLTNDAMNPRLDNLIFAHLELTLPIKDWLFVSVGDDLSKNFSNCSLATMAGPIPLACEYFRNDVWGRIGVAY